MQTHSPNAPAEPATAPQGPRAEAPADGLPLGTRLGEFELTGHVGVGGFSIVYLAWDHSLDRRVAIKEYLPASLGKRVAADQVVPRTAGLADTFELGLRSFINEAKALARFDHPALVKVYRFWEANGTAYMVMPFYQGRTLKEVLRESGRKPDEAWLMALLGPLTIALSVIHAEQWFHRDIAPDNIILLAENGKPLLLDFGAARRVITDQAQALTVILKPGYAPVEQYAEIPGMTQGPWTDVYALAATLYWAITGATPPSSISRIVRDDFKPASVLAAGLYSPRFLRAVDDALAVRPEHRTPSMAHFRAALGLEHGPLVGQPLPMRAFDPEATVIQAPVLQTRKPAAPTSAPVGADSTVVLASVSHAADGRTLTPANPTVVGVRRGWTRVWLGLGPALLVIIALWGISAVRQRPGPPTAPVSGTPPAEQPGAAPTAQPPAPSARPG
jgi:serine/threonine protein kinase